MNIKIHSSELNRMMKTITQCIDQRSPKLSNICLTYDNNLLTIRATNSTMSAVMYTPYLGGDGESICVDGTMFARVCSMCGGEVSISTDGNVCTIKGNGRTRIPIVDEEIPAFKPVSGKKFSASAEAISKGYNGVSYAISNDQSRIQLTGVLAECTGGKLKMVALDGFKMATECFACEGDDAKVIIPSAFMKLVSSSTMAGETILFETDGVKIQAKTDGMMLACSLLAGDYPDYKRIMPGTFKTECVVKVEQLRNALKSNSVVCSNNLVKLEIGEENMVVKGNSESADYTAEVECKTHGDGLVIAFNQKYMQDTIGSLNMDEVSIGFNAPTQPAVLNFESDCNRLILPVRVQG